MPTVSALDDIKSLIERYAQIDIVSSSNVRSATGTVLEFHSNCPWCGGHDRFITRPETGQYTCSTRSSGCGRHGDGIDFLVEYANMTRAEAMETLGLQDVSFYDAEKPNNRHENSSDVAPPKKWREEALIAHSLAERYLWMDIGKPAREILHGRGFKDDTLKEMRAGFMPLNKDGKWYFRPFEECGLDPAKYPGKDGVRIPDGIFVPYFVGDEIWKIEMIRPWAEKMPKGQVVGSTDCLYNVNALQFDEIAMMVEAAIDAWSVIQEAGDLVNCVATGGTPKCKSPKWISELSLAKFILQSFDEDKDGAGDKGAEYWLDLWNVPCDAPRGTPEKIARWSPMICKDSNDLLKAQLKGETDGFTLREWVRAGIQVANTAMNIDLAFPTLARDVQQELEIAPLPEIQSIPLHPQEVSRNVSESEPAQELTEDDKLLIYADTIRQVVDVFGGPGHVTMTRHDGRTLEQTLREQATYKPVTLPALPRKKCPHGLVTLKRKSDEMTNGIHAACRANPLDHGWCEYHAGSYELLQLGAKLGYPKMDLTVSVIDHGKRQNIGRFILSGVENWEAHAETTSPMHVKQDIARIQARHGL